MYDRCVSRVRHKGRSSRPVEMAQVVRYTWLNTVVCTSTTTEAEYSDRKERFTTASRLLCGIAWFLRTVLRRRGLLTTRDLGVPVVSRRPPAKHGRPRKPKRPAAIADPGPTRGSRETRGRREDDRARRRRIFYVFRRPCFMFYWFCHG